MTDLQNALKYDPEWFIAVGILALLTVLFVVVVSFAMPKEPKPGEQPAPPNEDGPGCGCMIAIGMFFLCYMWTAVIVSMEEYGRPNTKSPEQLRQEYLDRENERTRKWREEWDAEQRRLKQSENKK